jgi:hypothetical protein
VAGGVVGIGVTKKDTGSEILVFLAHDLPLIKKFNLAGHRQLNGWSF